MSMSKAGGREVGGRWRRKRKRTTPQKTALRSSRQKNMLSRPLGSCDVQPNIDIAAAHWLGYRVEVAFEEYIDNLSSTQD
ncbi:unnamed protein product [Sphagnum balticum]